MAAWGAKELGKGAGSPWGHLGLSPMTLLLPWLGDLVGGPNTREGKSAQCRVWRLLRGNFWPSGWPEVLSLVFRGDTLTHWVISVLGGLPLHSPRPSPSPSSLPRRAVHGWDQHGAGGSCGGQSHGLGPDLLGCPLMGQNMVGVGAHRGTKGRERNRALFRTIAGLALPPPRRGLRRLEVGPFARWRPQASQPLSSGASFPF